MNFKLTVHILTLSLIYLTSSDCIQYGDKQCLKCSENMILKDGKCWTLIMEKKQIPIVNYISGSKLSWSTSPTANLDLNKKTQTLNNAFQFSIYYNQPAGNQQNEEKYEQNSPVILTKISERTVFGEPIAVKEISIEDVMSATTNNTYIQQIYSDLSNQIINQQINRISLQLFDYSKMRAFDQDYDTVLKQIYRRNEQLFKDQMKCKIPLAVFYKYNLPIKTYKLFYTQKNYLNQVPFFCIQSIVNLFSYQIYTSQLSLYSNITIAPNVLEQIRNKTRGR